jgi:20S proteasome alpha/beta subunit
MTLIIAFKHKDSVILAGDKMGSDGFTKDINKKPKNLQSPERFFSFRECK